MITTKRPSPSLELFSVLFPLQKLTAHLSLIAKKSQITSEMGCFINKVLWSVTRTARFNCQRYATICYDNFRHSFVVFDYARDLVNSPWVKKHVFHHENIACKKKQCPYLNDH